MNILNGGQSSQQLRAPLTRMRFARQCVDELRKLDPSCPITESFIRALVKRGLVASVSIGRRRLVNFDDLLRYLSMPQQGEPTPPGGIRKIPERF